LPAPDPILGGNFSYFQRCRYLLPAFAAGLSDCKKFRHSLKGFPLTIDTQLDIEVL
jgi:hypothetical protein